MKNSDADTTKRGVIKKKNIVGISGLSDFAVQHKELTTTMQ